MFLVCRAVLPATVRGDLQSLKDELGLCEDSAKEPTEAQQEKDVPGPSTAHKSKKQLKRLSEKDRLTRQNDKQREGNTTQSGDKKKSRKPRKKKPKQFDNKKFKNSDNTSFKK